MKGWKVHAPRLDSLFMDRVLELARRTPYYDDAVLAADLLVNDAHWEKAATDTRPPDSRVRHDFADDLCSNGVTAVFNGTPKAWGLLTARPEPTKIPPRFRAISDMLWSNAALDDTKKVRLSTSNELFGKVSRNKHACTFDFTGWFYSLAIGDRVQPFLCFRIGKTIFTHLRAPMGHKWMVFIAHTITCVLAWSPHVEWDAIIDNVMYASNDKDILAAEKNAFMARCEYVRATLGETTEIGDTVTYRGINMHMGQTVGVKPSWTEKFTRRIETVLEGRCTAAMIYSLGGMIAWLRGILESTTLENYWWWRTVARAANMEPWKTVTLTTHVRDALNAIRVWISSDIPPRRSVAIISRVKALLVTDASLARPLGRWGAMVVTTTMRCFGGLFPVALCKVASIADLETAAILLTLHAAPSLASSFDIHAMTDNQVTHLVLTKRRCSAWRLHMLCRAIHVTVSARGSTLTTSWIPSAENPTDGISRGRQVTDADTRQLMTLVRKSGMDPEEIVHTNDISIISLEQCGNILPRFLVQTQQQC